MDDEEVLQDAHLLFSGGVDTTSGAMAWSIVHLHRDPQLRARVRGQPSILTGAVDEFLRFYPPFVGSARTMVEAVVVCCVRRPGAARYQDLDLFGSVSMQRQH